MGTGRRNLTMAAVAVVCAVMVLGGAGTAFADTATQARPPERPAPTPPGPTPPGPTPSAPAQGPDGSTVGSDSSGSARSASDERLEKVRKQIDKLYRDAALATDEYNAAEEKADQQSAAMARLAARIVDVRKKLDELHDQAGAAARAQYRDVGLPPQARLWLSNDPREFLDNTERMRQGQHAAQGLIEETRRTEDKLRQYQRDARVRWQTLEANRKEKAEAQKRLEKQIKAAKQLETRLEKEEKERLAALEAERARQAQAAWLNSGAVAVEDLGQKATGAAKRAVRFATGQIGKPYVWGAEGPSSYDCSGLTSQAWAHAGLVIPRTSQEQWRQLPQVPVKDMRPGDLVIYFDDATHVGMYVGDGKIVHAPRPGRSVTLAGAGTMPILGVVRPPAA